MGIDVGFDLYPPLGGPDDAELWNAFLKKVECTFRCDPVFVELDDRLEFQVGEYPSLYVNPMRFRRFSSKVSGKCGAAEMYISQVHDIAKEFFHDRIHFWSEYGECRYMYTWTQVYAAAARTDKGPVDEAVTKAAEGSGNQTLLFPDVCALVLHVWEHVHEGMDGLHFASATFPVDSGYSIIQEERGSILSQVNSIGDWADDTTDPIVKKAYWATRVNNNCATVNMTLLEVLQNYHDVAGIKELSIPLGDKVETITLDSLSLRTVALSPHYIGTIVEPPFTSSVPPSDDDETHHTFVVGLTKKVGIPIALDCSAAQFGVVGDGDEPFLAMPLAPYFRRLGKKIHILKDAEEEHSSAMLKHAIVRNKVDSCVRLALEAIKSSGHVTR